MRQFDLLDSIDLDIGLDSAYVDSNLVRGKRYWYSVTSFGIPDRTIIERPGQGGGTIRDTIYSPGPESPITENVVKVDLACP